ncbi:MAG: hypothetical protein WA009_12415 [Phototrophicaceae bacterium]
MQKIMIWACLLLTLIVVPARAQDTDYQLREPSVEEFVSVIQAALNGTVILHPTGQYEKYPVAATAIVDEVEWRFLKRNHLAYHQMEAVYRQLAGGIRTQHGLMAPEPWLRKVIELWLNENPHIITEISERSESETETIEFDGYRLEVEPLRSSLGSHGGVLWGYYIHVVEEPGARNIGFIAIQEDDRYVLPQLPASMDSELLAYGDLNGDDDPDIAYLHSEHTDALGSSGVLIIASRRDDSQFEQLDSLPYFTGGYEFPPQSYNWWFAPTDVSETTNILQSQTLETNWGCSFVQVKLFAWNEQSRLVNRSTENVYPATFECLVLQAEQAMWSHDYAESIDLYEQAFATGTPVTDLSSYARIRLAVAYLITEESERADGLLAELAGSESDFVRSVLMAYERDPRLLPICQTMYRYAFEGEEKLQSNGVLETYGGGFNRFTAGGASFDVDTSSCDISYHLDTVLSRMTFSVNESPLARLQSLGLDLAGHIEADLNLDGVSEWLIWLDAPGIDPLFFSTSDDHYRVSRPRGYSMFLWIPDDDLRQPTDYNSYDIVTVPNAAERVIVNIDFDIDQRAVINCAGNCGGGGDARCTYGDGASLPRFPGDLTMWRMQNGSLVNILLAPLCEFSEVDALFTSPSEQAAINAGAYRHSAEFGDENVVVPVIYTWDPDAQTYLAPTSTGTNPAATIVASPTVLPEHGRAYTLLSFDSLRSAFLERDLALVVTIADDALASATDADLEDWKHAFRYYRALALEALNRPAQATVDYVAIYEATPGSDWGMLAALHFERIRGE